MDAREFGVCTGGREISSGIYSWSPVKIQDARSEEDNLGLENVCGSAVTLFLLLPLLSWRPRTSEEIHVTLPKLCSLLHHASIAKSNPRAPLNTYLLRV